MTDDPDKQPEEAEPHPQEQPAPARDPQHYQPAQLQPPPGQPPQLPPGYYPPGAPPPGYAGYPPYYAPPRPTSGLAIAALVLGIMGTGLPAVICGHLAMSKIRQSGGYINGKGMAIAGLVLGYFFLMIFLAYIAFFVLIIGAVIGTSGVSSYSSATGDQAKAENMARQLRDAIEAYHTEYGTYPGAGSGSGTDTARITDADLLSLLTGDPAHPDNPRSIQFLNIYSPKLSPTGDLVDPWGKPYEVYLDNDGDGQVTIGGSPVTEPVAIRSPGADRRAGTGDDVTSY